MARGFSLLEFVVVLLIISLLLTVSTVRGSLLLNRSSLLRAAAELTADLNFGLIAAGSIGRPVVATFSREGYVIAEPESGAVILVKELPRNVTIERASFATFNRPRAARFNADGTTSPGTVLLRSTSGIGCSVIQSLRGAHRTVVHSEG
jgi:prepilin-type N-terminal cleavage/methylation domain-containing protein